MKHLNNTPNSSMNKIVYGTIILLGLLHVIHSVEEYYHMLGLSVTFFGVIIVSTSISGYLFCLEKKILSSSLTANSVHANVFRILNLLILTFPVCIIEGTVQNPILGQEDITIVENIVTILTIVMAEAMIFTFTHVKVPPLSTVKVPKQDS